MGCERSGSGGSPKGTSLPGVQGEELLNGTPVLGLLTMTGEGRSVGREECPDSECKGSMTPEGISVVLGKSQHEGAALQDIEER